MSFLQSHAKDVSLLPHTFPLWKWLLTWFIWKCPVLRLAARTLCPKRNPYRRVVVIVDVSALVADALREERKAAMTGAKALDQEESHLP